MVEFFLLLGVECYKDIQMKADDITQLTTELKSSDNVCCFDRCLPKALHIHAVKLIYRIRALLCIYGTYIFKTNFQIVLRRWLEIPVCKTRRKHASVMSSVLLRMAAVCYF